MAVIYAVGTLDTKGAELQFLAECIRNAGTRVVVVDVGTKDLASVVADVPRSRVAEFHPDGPAAVLGHTDRGAAMTAMGVALSRFLAAETAAGKVAGVVGIGGSGGSSLLAQAFRELPIGLPKLLVSTMACGDTRPYVGTSDVTMMYSVVDVAGLNRVLRRVLANAAHAIVGMATHEAPQSDRRPTVGMTMFGVTTPCVTAVRQTLEADGIDCLVFHATGSGGQAMERLVASGMIDGVLDVTTTEVADEIVGGVLTAGPERFDAIVARGIPYVMSLGACDMVNFGPRDTVPAGFEGRKFHIHNPTVTLMRTTPEENRRIGEFITRKVNRTKAPFILLIPEKGVSAIDSPDQPFHDPEADAALFDSLDAIQKTADRQVRRLPFHINDPEFAAALVAAYREVSERARNTL